MTLRLWTNGFDTYVAESPADILAMHKAWSGEDLDGDEQFIERTDAKITITIADAEPSRERVTKTAAEWIADNGPGLLCSTEF
jgi:hypothetical protein